MNHSKSLEKKIRIKRRKYRRITEKKDRNFLKEYKILKNKKTKRRMKNVKKSVIKIEVEIKVHSKNKSEKYFLKVSFVPLQEIAML